MIPSDFEYYAPRSLREALDLLARNSDAKVLGGGMSLIPALKHRLQTPAALVDLGRVPELESVSERRGKIAIGGRSTHRSLAQSDEIADVHALRETASAIGDVQVRNRGTIGGSLVHADPAADWPAVFLALDGEAVVAGARGERTIPASEFFVGMLQSAVRRGRIDRACVAVTGVNPVPFRAAALEKRLAGESPDRAALARLCARIEEADPMEDLHASAPYRAHLCGVFAARAVLAAAQRAAA